MKDWAITDMDAGAWCQLCQRVMKWAEDRNLVKQTNLFKQLLYTQSEAGEVATAWLKGSEEELIDGIGDVLVTLIISYGIIAGASPIPETVSKTSIVVSQDEMMLRLLKACSLPIAKAVQYDTGTSMAISNAISIICQISSDLDYDPAACLEKALNVIEKRKGKTVDGIFVKDQEHA